jgi:hypothetical protein
MKIVLGSLCVLVLFALPMTVQAMPMSSASFSVQGAGFSCGGAPASSASFSSTATIGQATPLMYGAAPGSTSFRNFPGLRYLLEVAGLEADKSFLNSIYLLLLGDE